MSKHEESKSDRVDEFLKHTIKRLEQMRAERRAMEPEEAGRLQPEFEREVFKIMNEVGRELTREDLERLDVDAPGVVIGEQRYRRKGKSCASYQTLGGVVEVERTLYVARGGGSQECVVPMELRAGLVGGWWTPLSAEVASLYVEAVPARKACELLSNHGGMSPSASTLDRLPKVFNALWEPVRVELEAQLREEDEWPEAPEVAAVAFSLDGVMLPLKGAPRTPTPQGPKGHREAYSATVFLLDKQGNRLKTVPYARAPEKRKVALAGWLKAELCAAKARYPSARFVAVADGAEENWRIISALNLEVGVKSIHVLDFYHLAEHLAEALNSCFGKGSTQADEHHTQWKKALLERPHGARTVVAELANLVSKAPNPSARQVIQRELAYFKSHHDKGRLRYAALERENLPRGSGVQEAACRTLVVERLRLSGQTWNLPGAQGVLTLRSLQQAGRLSLAWKSLGQAVLRKPVHIDPNQARKRPVIPSC